MHVSALYTYPIKSCGGLTHDAIHFDTRGPIWDRRWVVTDADGMFYTQRELPAMALIQPTFEDGLLRLTAPGMSPISVSLEAERGAFRSTRRRPALAADPQPRAIASARYRPTAACAKW